MLTGTVERVIKMMLKSSVITNSFRVVAADDSKVGKNARKNNADGLRIFG